LFTYLLNYYYYLIYDFVLFFSFSRLFDLSNVAHALRHGTIEEFNVDSKADYSALSSTRSRKKYKKETKTNKRQCPFTSVQVKIREGSPERIRVTMEERICERDDF